MTPLFIPTSLYLFPQMKQQVSFTYQKDNLIVIVSKCAIALNKLVLLVYS